MRNYNLTINEKTFDISLLELSAEEATLTVNGSSYTVSIERISESIARAGEGPPELAVSGIATSSTLHSPSSEKGAVVAPIPGSVLEVYVQSGEKVRAGQPLFKMEAMKMENEISAQMDGTITAIYVHPGDTVSQGQEIMLIGPAAAKRGRG